MKMRALALILVLLLNGSPVVAEPGGDAATAKEAGPVVLKDPYFLLMRDAGVRERLGITADQQRKLDAILRRENRLLLAIRDVGPQGVPDEVKPKVAAVRSQIDGVLNDSQRARVEGLVLQAQGYDGLLRPDVTQKLGIDSRQQDALRAINRAFEERVSGLDDGHSPRSEQKRQQEIRAARAEQHRQVLAVLDESQKQQWSVALGEPLDFGTLSAGPAWAPEFVGIETWVNSPALSMESLRGRVVVVHFFAFNCINCIHNYPWYREWQDAYADKDVTIIGIHTPETQAEMDVASLKGKLAENDLRFPVAVDTEKKTWQAWSNSIWPSVYIIDRKGRLRYWWYGELDWNGAGGQKLARQRIDELLAERVPGEGGG